MVPRTHRETKGWYQHLLIKTMGLDHVGHHHQRDLRAVLQELSCRSAEAKSTEPPVGLRSRRTGRRASGARYHPQEQTEHSQAGNVRLLRSEARAGPGQGLRVKAVQARFHQARKGLVKLSDRFGNSLGFHQNFVRSRVSDRPASAKTHIVSAGVGRCVILLLLSGQCVSPATTGWDWPEFRPANAALRSGLSSAAPAIALKKFPLLSTP
jgi:hypothetical protein